MEPMDLISAFDNSFSEEFQVEALRQLEFTYRESVMIANSEYSGGFGKNVRPQIRVEKFNRRIVDLAKQFGILAEERLTTAKNYRFAYLEGEEMALLVKLGSKPSKLPKPSVYRCELVASNNPDESQLSLLDDPSSHANVVSLQAYKERKDSNSKKGKPCGILVHGYSGSASINFAQVLVPDARYSSWLASVNLLARYSNVLAAPKEEVIEINQPTIRRKDLGEGDA